MNHTFTMQDAMDVAANKVSIEGWEGYVWEALDGDDCLVTGCVPDGVYSRGPKKGKPRFSKPVEGTTKKVAVSLSELQSAAMKYESETGKCWDCKGTGKVFKSWNHKTGTEHKECSKCKGTGKSNGK